MKVGELREKLAKKSQGELIKLASEFYKLIPKEKKEDYDVDGMVNNQEVKGAKKVKDSKNLSIIELEHEIVEFIKNAKDQLYLYPNKQVSKKERSTWRFKVKKWYKELINLKRQDANGEKQLELLSNLYELLCESCNYQYFSAYDTFESIKIDQDDFYKSVLELIKAVKGKKGLIEKGVDLILNNPLNRYTLYSGLMMVLIEELDIPDLKNGAIEYVKQLLKQDNYQAPEKSSWESSSEEYRQEERNNNLSELGLRLCISLSEMQKGIQLFKDNYYYRDEEIKLYVLISILMRYKEKDQIRRELELAMQKGIQPREKLLNLLKTIKEENTLPNYL